MADQLQIQTVSCAGGLNTSRDVLSQGQVQPGSASRLINYEPSINGGYRRISGYDNAYPSLPGTGSVLGVCVANAINDGILACRTPSSGNNYLHAWNTTTESWDTVTTSGSPTMTGVEQVRFAKYNFSGSNTVAMADGVNPAATYNGTTYTQITHANAPDAPSLVVEFANHLFLAGDSDHSDEIYYSAPLADADFSPANGAGSINVGFEVVTMKPFRSELYIFGTNEIKKLSGNNQANFVLADVTKDLGCVAADSVVEIGGDLIFMGPDGLRPVSGTDKIGDVNLETVSKSIQSIVSNIISSEDLTKLRSVLIRSKSQFRFFFDDTDSSSIIGALRETPNGIGFEFGQLLGIEATACDSGYIGHTEYVIHGDTSGKVHRQEVGTSFDGTDIFSLYQTPYLHMGDPELRKNFLRVSTYMRSEGDSSIAMGIVYDYEDIYVSNPNDFTVSTSGAAAYYGEAAYDSTAIYSGNPSPVVKTNISGSGTSIALKYVTNDQNASHTIQGYVLLFGLGDRR